MMFVPYCLPIFSISSGKRFLKSGMKGCRILHQGGTLFTGGQCSSTLSCVIVRWDGPQSGPPCSTVAHTQKYLNIPPGEALQGPQGAATHTEPRPGVNAAPSVSHPLSKWRLTTSIHRHNFAIVTDKNTEACFSRIQTVSQNYTAQVSGW